MVPSRTKDLLRRRGPALGALLAVAGLFAYAFASRASYLLATPYPTGVDGYWYPVQLRSLLETGHLAYPSAPLVLWLMAPLARLTDPIVGAKLGAAAGTAALVVPAYLLARRLCGERVPALLGAVLAATSAQGFYLATEFVKEGVGLAFAVGFLAALAAALERPTRLRVGLCVALLCAAFLAHKSAFGVALVIGAFPLASRMKRRWLAILIVIACAATALAVGRDPGLIGRLVGRTAEWSLPVLAVPGRSPLRLGNEVALTAALAVLVLATSLLPRRLLATPRLPTLAVGLCAFALVLAVPWLNVADEQGLAYRLRLTAAVATAPLAALLVTRAMAAAPRAGRTAVALALAAGLLAARPSRSSEGVVLTHPALVTAVRALEGSVPSGATVITPERHVAFMAVWYARTATRVTLPKRIDPALTYRLLPGAEIDPELARALGELRAHPRPDVPPPRDLHPWGENGLVLLAENTFQDLVAGLSPARRTHYLSWPIQ